MYNQISAIILYNDSKIQKMFYGVYDVGILDATIFLSDTSYDRWVFSC